jgi:hypothetical protein
MVRAWAKAAIDSAQMILQTAIPADEELEKGRGITKKDHRV